MIGHGQVHFLKILLLFLFVFLSSSLNVYIDEKYINPKINVNNMGLCQCFPNYVMGMIILVCAVGGIINSTKKEKVL